MAGLTIVAQLGRWLQEHAASGLATGKGRVAAALAAGAAVAAVAWTLAAAGSGATTGTGTGLVLAVAAVVLALVSALAIVAPWAGLIVWIGVMGPLNVARLGVPLAGILVTQTSVILLAIVAGLGLARWRGRPALGKIPRPLLVIALLSAAVAIASGATAAERVAGVTIALHGVVEPAIVVVLVVGLATSVGRVRILAAAMVGSVALATLYNLERLLRITFDLSIAQADRTAFARFTYYNVGIFGDMLAMTLPLAIVLFVESRDRVWSSLAWPRLARLCRVALGCSVAVLAVGLYLTFTKGPWLAALLSVTTLVTLLVRTSRARAVTIGIAIVLSLLIVPYPAYLLRAVSPALGDQSLAAITIVQGGNRADSWDPETAEGEVSIHERLLATEAAFAMAIDHPLVGVGPGGFAAAYADGYRPAQATRALGSAHDMLPDVAAEYGIPLAVVLAVAIVAVLLAAWRTIRRRASGRLLGLGLGAAFVAFLIVGVSFGVDLYRPWRVMNSDVVFAALLAGAILGLARSTSADVAGPGSAGLVDRSTRGEARV